MILAADEAMKTRPVYDPDYYYDEITDPEGNTEVMEEFSGVAIVDVNFTLTMDEIYKEYLEQFALERRMPI